MYIKKHIYIYTYIGREGEREREREGIIDPHAQTSKSTELAVV